MVIKKIVSWKRLSEEFKVSTKEVKSRWCKIVYPRIKIENKIGGALKWSSEEDSILKGGLNRKLTWHQIASYLPDRTEYSIEARWRRIQKNPMDVPKQGRGINKHQIRRQILKRIFMRQKEFREKSE